MAIQISYTDASGVAHPAAYARILEVRLDVAGHQGVVKVAIYHSAPSRTAGFSPVTEQLYIIQDAPAVVAGSLVISPEVTDFTDFMGDAVLRAGDRSPMVQGYRYMKTLDQYIRGRDV